MAVAALHLVGSVLCVGRTAVLAEVARGHVAVEEMVFGGERFNRGDERDGRGRLGRERRRGCQDPAGLDMRGPGAALAVPLVCVAIIELATRRRPVLHEGLRRSLETDIAGGEPHELIGEVLVVGGPKLVELDSRPRRRVEAVAEDGVRLLDEHH